jgi:hypothetical protein
MAIAGAALLICGLLADCISANRRLIEDMLHRVKRIEAAERNAGHTWHADTFSASELPRPGHGSRPPA